MSNQLYPPYAPLFILASDGELHGIDTPGNRELVRRMQACVAACEGISTEELERGIVQDMQRVISQVVPLLEHRREGSELPFAPVGLELPGERAA